MKIRFALHTLAAAAAACAVLAFPFAANATTVDDVAAVARHYGYPEETIQEAYNKYYSNPEKYDSDYCDAVIEILHDYGYNLITTGPQRTMSTTTAATTTAVTTVPSGEKPSEPSKEAGTITLTDNNGNTFTRISREEFIKLSYEDKMNYIATFTPEQQQIIIDNLSPEEYRSLLKTAPQDKKFEVVDDIVKAADAMGVNLTVNEISDDNISLAMHNEDGELIGIAHAGNSVEDTGYDRSGLLKTAAVLFAVSAAAVAVLMKKCFGKGSVGEKND